MFNFAQDFSLTKCELYNFINLPESKKELVRNWRNDADIKKWMITDHIISKSEHLSFIESLKNDNKNTYWLVADKNIELGVVSLTRIDCNNKNAYLGIYANPGLNKVGSKLMASLMDVSFNLGGLHSLKLEVREDNKRAIEFYKKSGFKREGLLRDMINKDGIWYNLVIMGLVNEKPD